MKITIWRAMAACAVCAAQAAGQGTTQAPAASPPKESPAKEAPAKPAAPAGPRGVDLIHQQAGALKAHAKTEPAWKFLAAAGGLPRIEPRVMLRDPKTRAFYSEASAAKLPEEERAALQNVTLDEHFYYTTKYGSPLAFVRPMEVLGKHGFGDPEGKRMLDFGYGSIGHLKMLVGAGADVVGVEVDQLLRELYSHPGDQGPVSRGDEPEGRVRLVDGRWPGEAKEAVGGGFDVFVSKNTLKNGYIHPEREVDKRMLVDLGVEDAAFVKALYEIMNPGGWVLIYNLCPAPAPPDKPYIPWADGRCPFPKEMWESAGFKVVAFDVNDDEAARAMGKALGWDQGPNGMDIEKDLFALYTLVRKPAAGGW